MSESGVIVCMRVDEITEPVAGSVIQQCDGCGVDIYVAPRSLSVLTEAKELALPVDAICFACLVIREEVSGRAEVHPSLEGDEFLNRILEERMKEPDS